MLQGVSCGNVSATDSAASAHPEMKARESKPRAETHYELQVNNGIAFSGASAGFSSNTALPAFEELRSGCAGEFFSFHI